MIIMTWQNSSKIYEAAALYMTHMIYVHIPYIEKSSKFFREIWTSHMVNFGFPILIDLSFSIKKVYSYGG